VILIYSGNSAVSQVAPASGANKQLAKAPKVNVDKKGVILKGYDAVAYFKESRGIKEALNTRVPTAAPFID
jgi:hypothetical protein